MILIIYKNLLIYLIKMKEKDSDDEEEMKTYKVILIGESTVGKTSIMNRFHKNNFKEILTPSSSATYVEKIIKLEIYKKEIQFGIWDTMGQEKYRSITKNYFQNATAAILVYDITDKRSFEEIENFWYDHVIQYCSKDINKCLFFLIIKIFIIIVIAIAANKSDLYEFEKVNEEEVKKFADKNDAIFKITSANTGNGINDLFEEIGNKIMDPNYRTQLLKKRNSKVKNKNNKIINVNNTNNTINNYMDNKENDIKKKKTFKIKKIKKEKKGCC